MVRCPSVWFESRTKVFAPNRLYHTRDETRSRGGECSVTLKDEATKRTVDATAARVRERRRARQRGLVLGVGSRDAWLVAGPDAGTSSLGGVSRHAETGSSGGG